MQVPKAGNVAHCQLYFLLLGCQVIKVCSRCIAIVFWLFIKKLITSCSFNEYAGASYFIGGLNRLANNFELIKQVLSFYIA
jgi:hypothetical protein